MAVALTLRDLDETLDRIYDRMTQTIESEYTSKIIKNIKEWWYTPNGLNITVHNIDGTEMPNYTGHLKLDILSDRVHIKTGRVTLDTIHSTSVGFCYNVNAGSNLYPHWEDDFQTFMRHLYAALAHGKPLRNLTAMPCQPDATSKCMRVAFEVRDIVSETPDTRYHRSFFRILFVLKPGMPAPFDITGP